MRAMKISKRFASILSRQKWLPYRTRRSVLKRLCPDLLKDHPFTTTMEGGLVFRGNVVNYIDRLIYFCGAHEKYMLHFLRDIVPVLREMRPGGISFMDVGANAGNHSLYMARLAERVYAFEPFERVRTQLEQNIGLNALFNVHVFPFGLGKANARLPFFAGPDANLGAASFRENHYEGNHLIGESEIRIGDHVVAQENLGRIDIIKADVEGFEKDVLLGLAATIKRDRPVMVIELSPTTRNHIIGVGDFFQLFPEKYQFFYFAKGDRDSGVYQLGAFDYAQKTDIQDVIAIPRELGIAEVK